MLVARISRPNKSTDAAHRLSRLNAASTIGRQLTVEFIGTFILVLTVGLSTSSTGAGDLAPLAIGSARMVMVFAGGHISGAHYNPAVSFAALLAGRLRLRQTVSYVLTQLAAGALAALLVRAFVQPTTPAVLGSDWKILVGELIFTLALAYVVLNVTAAEATEGNSFYGLAIGFTLTTGILAVGRTTGGVVQPRGGVGRQRHRSTDVEPFMDLPPGEPARRSQRRRPLHLPPPVFRGR
jgi:aquaporin Z